ncbi:MAG: hypothetical protein ABSG36_14860 [Acidimicrobiales bacterium]|jgi:hypothetical protein
MKNRIIPEPKQPQFPNVDPKALAAEEAAFRAQQVAVQEAALRGIEGFEAERSWEVAMQKRVNALELRVAALEAK